jgi:hypothetical protein
LTNARKYGKIYNVARDNTKNKGKQNIGNKLDCLWLSNDLISFLNPVISNKMND